MFFNQTENSGLAPDLYFFVCDRKGAVENRIGGVQSAKVVFDIENPSTLELEVAYDKSLKYVARCDGRQLIKAMYRDFVWYFVPRSFELSVDKLTTPIAKFSGVDAMAAFRTQIAYNGVSARNVWQSFRTTVNDKLNAEQSYLGKRKFVKASTALMSAKRAQFKTRAMNWGEVMDTFTEQAGLRFVIDTVRGDSGLENTLVWFEPGGYVSTIDRGLSGYVPRWRFEGGDFNAYESKTSAAESQVLMMYDDAEDVNDSRTLDKVEEETSLFEVRETIMHTPKEMFANIIRDPSSSPDVGFFAQNASPRADITVKVSDEVANRMRDAPRGDSDKLNAYKTDECWRPGMMVDVVIGIVKLRQEIVRAELELSGGRFRITPVLATPGTSSRDFYDKFGTLNNTVQRMAQRGVR